MASATPFRLRKWRWSGDFCSLPRRGSSCSDPAAPANPPGWPNRFPQAVRLDLLAPEVLRAYQARPERLRARIAAEPAADTVVIDEIQKAPQLLDVVHALLEERSGLRFVLTGSSARKLRHGAANLLGGRLVAASMPPFMGAELGDAFDFSRALDIGLVPLIWQAADPKASLEAYASLYLQEEVQAEALVRQIGNFSRFLEGEAQCPHRQA